MFVYVIGPSDGPYKIGVAGSVERRLRALQTAHYLDLCIHYAVEVDGAERIEYGAHAALSHKRMRGEWYDATLAECISAISSNDYGRLAKLKAVVGSHLLASK